MADPNDKRDRSDSIALFMVVIVALAIIIISALTITAILNGPPAI